VYILPPLTAANTAAELEEEMPYQLEESDDDCFQLRPANKTMMMMMMMMMMMIVVMKFDAGYTIRRSVYVSAILTSSKILTITRGYD